MVAVTVEAARLARAEAGRLRVESVTLRLALRHIAADSREQRRTAEAALGRLYASRQWLSPSPWSSLDWTRSDEELEQALVPVD